MPIPSRLSDPNQTGNFGPPAPSVKPSVNPSAGAAPVPGESDPSALGDMGDIIQITSAARRLAQKYPSAVPEVQAINDAVQQLQMKITSSQPPTEMVAPPQ